MSNKRNQPKRRAAPVKIIDDGTFPEDEEDDIIPHKDEEKILALIDRDTSTETSSDSTSSISSGSEDEEKVVPKKKESIKTRTFVCNSNDIIPREGSPELKHYEDHFFDANGPISAARNIFENLRQFIPKKKSNGSELSYFMVLHDGITAKKYSYVITISDEKYVIKTCSIKDIPVRLTQEIVSEKKVEKKKIDEIERVPIPELKGPFNKKIVPPLSDGSRKIVVDHDKNTANVAANKKVVKK